MHLVSITLDLSIADIHGKRSLREGSMSPREHTSSGENVAPERRGSRGITNDSTMHFRMLRARMWNDLLIDLDKTLLCPDENSRSRTDPMEFRQLLHGSTGNASILLGEITKCYEDASLLLRER